MPLTAEQQELAAKWVPLAHKLANRWAKTLPRMRDEIESAALFGLCRAAALYDPARGEAKFSTFAAVCVKNAIRAVRKADRRRETLAASGSPEGDEVQALDFVPDDAPEVGHELETRDLWAGLLRAAPREAPALLSPRNIELFERAVGEGESAADLAAEYQISRARVHQIIRHAAERFKSLSV